MRNTILKILFFPIYALLQFILFATLEGALYVDLQPLKYAAIVLTALLAVEMWQLIRAPFIKIAFVLVPFIVYWSLSWYLSGVMRFGGVFVDLGLWYAFIVLLALGFAVFKNFVRKNWQLRYYYFVILLLLPLLAFVKLPFNILEQATGKNVLDLSKKDFKTAYSEVFKNIRDNYYYFDLKKDELADIERVLQENVWWDSTKFDYEMERLSFRPDDGHFHYDTPQSSVATREWLGMWLNYNEGKHFVEAIHSSSNAFKSGVRNGFMLIAINGMLVDSAIKVYYSGYNIEIPAQSHTPFSFISMLQTFPGDSLQLTFLSPPKEEITVAFKNIPADIHEKKGRPVIKLHSEILSENIGYIRFNKWPFDPFFITDFDRVLQKMWDTKGVIIDLRGNSGGFGALIPFIAGRFARTPFSFGDAVNKENGEVTPLTVVPRSPVFKKKVVLLINERSVSASAYFILAAKKIPHLEIIGRPSLGLLSFGTKEAIFPQERSMILYNGGLVLKNTSDHHRQLNPHVLIPYDLDAIREGRDYELEFARKRF